MKKVFSVNTVVDRNLFQHLRMIFKINNSFAMKNDKISLFENFNHANHLNRKVNYKMYDVIDWIKNNFSTHISQYLKK